MQIIFGANGPSGRAFIRTLTNPTDTVAVLRKPPEDSFFSEHRIQTATADALDADALDKVFAQYRPDSVISFVGGKNEQGIRSPSNKPSAKPSAPKPKPKFTPNKAA